MTHLNSFPKLVKVLSSGKLRTDAVKTEKKSLTNLFNSFLILRPKSEKNQLQ